MRRCGYWLILLLFLFNLFLLSDQANAELIYKIPIEGNIDPGMVKIVEKGIRQAEIAGADLILLEINTYGGFVDSAVRIRDQIFATDLLSVTYVANRAWSAGALIALAGEKLAMIPGGSMGAAETRPNEEKYISALRKEFKATAERRGRNSRLAEAMVDEDVVVEELAPRGKLLTLTSEEASQNEMIDFIALNQDDLFNQLGYDNVKVVEVTMSSTEKFARVITRPEISAILLTLGFIALVFEMLTAGWGVGGTISIISFSLFFSGYMINGYASWGLIALFLSGILLLFLEIFIVPGFGITGISGITAILGSLYFLFPSPETALTVLATVMILTIVGTVVIIKYFGGSKFWKNISLVESQSKEAGYVASINEAELIGSKGSAVTPLRPAGIISVDGKRLDVVSEGEYIEKGEKVEIIKVAGSRIVVKKI